MSKKIDARIVRTRQIIQSATIALLTTQPGFSITTLLARADITRGTFYKYYANKEHLISEVNDVILNDLLLHTKETFIVAEMIASVSRQAAFYNAVLNHHADPSFQYALFDRLRTQMQTKVNASAQDVNRRLQYQWETINAGFWAMIARWLSDDMNMTQDDLLQEFAVLWRGNPTVIKDTGLGLFDFTPKAAK